jgi:hypothetical protein
MDSAEEAPERVPIHASSKGRITGASVATALDGILGPLFAESISPVANTRAIHYFAHFLISSIAKNVTIARTNAINGPNA